MEYPVEKHGIRFYNYYFYEVEKPLTIEATSKQEAREVMQSIIPNLSDKYRESKIIGETVTIPLLGVSEKVVKGIKYIWVGLNKSRNGWMSEQQYRYELQKSMK
jgi:hypothetical protein